MIEVRGLIKRYGEAVAVDDLCFEVPPRQVTGFLGPNRAGKSTAMFSLGMGQRLGITAHLGPEPWHAGSPAPRSQGKPGSAWVS